MRPGDDTRPRLRKSYFELPPLELECMKILWRLGEASVRDIREELNPSHPLAYTTVETIMDRLTRKGIVSRQKIGKAHRYTPRYPKAEARAQAVHSLLEHFFSGSRAALQAHLEGQPVTEPPPVPRSARPVPKLPRASRRASPSAPAPPEVQPPAARPLDPTLL